MILSCAHWDFPYIEYSRNFPYNKRLVILLQLVNFVSDLGGSLGLWIGMSVLSFAEVLELILLIAFALYVKLRRKLGGRIRSNSQIARKWIFMVYFFHCVNSPLFKVIWITKCETSDCGNENLSCHSILILIHKFNSWQIFCTSFLPPNSNLISKLDTGIKTGPSLNANLYDFWRSAPLILRSKLSRAAFFLYWLECVWLVDQFFFKELSDLGHYLIVWMLFTRIVLDFASCQLSFTN